MTVKTRQPVCWPRLGVDGVEPVIGCWVAGPLTKQQKVTSTSGNNTEVRTRELLDISSHNLLVQGRWFEHWGLMCQDRHDHLTYVCLLLADGEDRQLLVLGEAFWLVCLELQFVVSNNSSVVVSKNGRKERSHYPSSKMTTENQRYSSYYPLRSKHTIHIQDSSLAFFH